MKKAQESIASMFWNTARVKVTDGKRDIYNSEGKYSWLTSVQYWVLRHVSHSNLFSKKMVQGLQCREVRVC